MNTEQKAKAYDNAVVKIRHFLDGYSRREINKEFLADLFPELKEGEDEKVRKAILELVRQSSEILDKQNQNNMIAWLEKQCKESSWKPSKEEMDVLYGLAYITNQYDERKEEVITRLYQDLKREFFNGSSYENMFPTNTSMEEDVRRRSTIQVLEYARSLDAYNQYGKADIDKNIAWFEKQGSEPVEINPTEFDIRLQALIGKFDSLPKEELIGSLSFWLNVVQNDGTYKPDEGQGEQKPADKEESKFHEGDWVVDNECGKVNQITSVRSKGYDFANGDYMSYESAHKELRLWDISDAKDGDVLVCNEEILLFKSYSVQGRISLYCWYNGKTNNFHSKEVTDALLTTRNKICPATKEQRDLLFAKMKEAGCEWDAEKKELKEIPDALEECEIEHIEHGKYYYCIKDYYAGGNKRASKGDVVKALNGMHMMALGVDANEYFIPVKCIVDVRPAWSEEDEEMLEGIVNTVKDVRCQSLLSEIEIYDDYIDWLKQLKQRIGG